MNRVETKYKSIQFIEEHLPLWQKKGMSRAFLDSIISAGNGNYELDVESALSCNLDLFGEAFNQPDFVDKLTAICKKYCMQYGRVKPEFRKGKEEFVDRVYDEYFKDMPARIDGEKEDGIASADNSYFIHNVKNKYEIYNEIIGQIKTGDKKLSLTPKTIELLLSLARDNLSLQRIMEITCLSEKSVRRYYSALQSYNILTVAGGRVRGIKEFNVYLNYNKVIFEDGFSGGENYDSELWDI